MEEGKNPGLGIRELHEQGITGKGVRVAIIDQKLLTDHEEYRDKLVSYTEYGSAGKEPPSMHGPAVASLLVGEHCGVAPGVELVYAATPSGKPFLEFTKALNEILIFPTYPHLCAQNSVPPRIFSMKNISSLWISPQGFFSSQEEKNKKEQCCHSER